MELYIANISAEEQIEALFCKLDKEDFDIPNLTWPDTASEQTAMLDNLLCENGYERLAKSPLYKINAPCDKNILICCPCEIARNLFFHLWDLGSGYASQRIAAFPAGGLSRYAFQNYQDGYTAARCLYLNDRAHLYKAGLYGKD